MSTCRCGGRLVEMKKEELPRYKKIELVKEYQDIAEENEGMIILARLRICDECGKLYPKWLKKPHFLKF